MSSETSMTASKTLHRHEEQGLLFLTLTNSDGATLKVGQEVVLENNLTVQKRSAGSEFPIGVVTVGGIDGDLVTVATCFQRTTLAIAKGGTINVNTFVKPNGTVQASGIPEYVAAVAPIYSNGTTTSVLGDYASGIVLRGGNVDTEIVVGLFRQPIPIRGAISV